MENKKLITSLIIIIAAAAVVYFTLMHKPAQVPANTGTETPSTTNTTAPQGKLNINVVCESALSYMTFNDGASAEKFVTECKEGQHPEVIEHYKVQMNLGDGATI